MAGSPADGWRSGFRGLNSNVLTGGTNVVASVEDLVHAQHFIGTAIAVNIILLAAETDYPGLTAWWFCDVAFFLGFALEIGLRAGRFGNATLLSEHERLWTALDWITITGGALEVVLPLLGIPEKSALFSAIRLVRLLRLLRFLRIAKRVAALAQALMSMMDAFGVIFGVLFLFILLCAIICTQLMGRRHEWPADQPDVQGNFGDVPTSIFTLFQVTTLDNWMEVAGPVIVTDWRWQIFFVFFISFGSWTMISILTAVASDSMVAAASDREETEAREREALRERFLTFLRDAFTEADVDRNGVMDKQEFEALIKNETVLNYMSQQGVRVTLADLETAWDTLDASAGGSGELTIDEFVTGFLTLSKGISTHDIANVDYSLRRTSANAALRIQNLSQLVHAIKERNEGTVTALEGQLEVLREQLSCLELWRNWVLEQDPQALENLQDESQLQSLPMSDAGFGTPSA
mmetsp:Transcript_6882/g.16254  ORF Transcript_6882/g.16254 Transcript_6882/m.16254 type:complete len:464 (-) Transcript_6882:105-1496(-)